MNSVFLKIIMAAVIFTVPANVCAVRQSTKPSATIKIMEQSPPMSEVLNTNLLYTGGINTAYPEMKSLKRHHEKNAVHLIETIEKLGGLLDEMRAINASFDYNTNLQFLKWHTLASKNSRLNSLFSEEENLMNKSMDFQIQEATYWAVVDATRDTLKNVVKHEKTAPNYSLSQSYLYLNLLKLYLHLTDFYSEKQKALLIPAAALHALEDNSKFNLPRSVRSEVKTLHDKELKLMKKLIYKFMDTLETSFDGFALLDRLGALNNKMLSFSKEKIEQQYIDFTFQSIELRKKGLTDEASVIEGVMEQYKALMISRNLETAGERSLLAIQLKNMYRTLYSHFKFESVAYAGLWDSVKSGASIMWDTVKGTAKDVVNLPVEAWDKTTKGAADIIYGNQELSANNFIDGVKDSYAKVGKNKLGQDAMDKAQDSFKKADKYIDKVPLGQAVANVATFGGYGLAKDAVTLNDAKASTTDKVVAGVGVALSFIPIQAGAGDAAKGAMEGTKAASKTAMKSSVKIATEGAKVLSKKTALDVAKKEAYETSKALIKGQSKKLGKEALISLEKNFYTAMGKVPKALTSLLKSKDTLKTAVKDSITAVKNTFLTGLKKGFLGENKSALKTLVKSATGNIGKNITTALKEIGEEGIVTYIVKGIATEKAGDLVKYGVKKTVEPPKDKTPPKKPEVYSGYNPLNDPNLKSGTGKPVDVAQADKLSEDFQNNQKNKRDSSSNQGQDTQSQTVVQQPDSYTRTDKKPVEKDGTDQTPYNPYYPYPPDRRYPDDGYKVKDYTKWASEPRKQKIKPDTTSSRPEPADKPKPQQSSQPPADKTGIDVTIVGEAPTGKCNIVKGQLVPVKGYPERISGMTVSLSGPFNTSTTSSGSGSFSFSEIPAGDYVITVNGWDYGMTRQNFTAPSGKSIKIVLKGSCPFLHVWTGEQFEKENDIYSVARLMPHELIPESSLDTAHNDEIFLHQIRLDRIPQELAREKTYMDYYLLSRVPKEQADGTYLLKIAEQANERSFTDFADLRVVDHSINTSMGITQNGQVFLFENLKEIPSWLSTVDTVNTGSAGTGLYNGEGIEFLLPREAFTSGVLAVTWQGFIEGNAYGHTSAKGRPGLFLQRQSPEGKWQSVDKIYPRDENQQSFFIIRDLGKGWDQQGKIRLIAKSCNRNKYHRIVRIAWTKLLDNIPEMKSLELVSAVKSDGEEVSRLLQKADGESLSLGPSEEVTMKFKAEPPRESLQRSFIFLSEGFYIPLPFVHFAAR